MESAVQSAAGRTSVSREIGQAAKHAFIYGAGGILQKAATFLLLPLYTHYLSPKDYGILEILNLAMSVLSMFLAMGITNSLVRYYGTADSVEEKRRVVSTAYGFVSVTGIALFSVSLLIYRQASALLFGADVPSSYLLLMVAFFCLSYINSVPAAYLRASESSLVLVILETGGAIAILVLSVYFVVALKLAIFGMLLSQLVVLAIYAPVLAIWIWRSAGIGVDREMLRKLISFGAPLAISNLAMLALNFSDRLFLKRFASLDTVGIYSVGYKFGYILNFLLIQPFNMMWMARMFAIHRRPDYERVFARIFVLYSLILIFAGLVLSLYSGEVVAVMADARYATAAQVVAPVVLAYVFLGIGTYLELGALLTSKTGRIGVVSGAAAGINLLLNYVLIPRFGMIGAAWATTLGFLALAIGLFYYSHRAYPLDLGMGKVIRALIIAIAIYLVSWPISMWPPAVAVALKILLAGVFCLALRLARVVSAADLETASSLGRSALSSAARRLKLAFSAAA